MIRYKIGENGDDVLDASTNPNNNWIMHGGGGNDRLTGGNKADLLVGDGGNDSLNGGAGNDMLYGGADADTLIGGLGRDLLHGGSGADIFEFNAINESGNTTRTADVIVDFVEGLDKIDLSSIPGVVGYAGPELNTAVAPHSVFWTQSGGNTIVQVNATFDQTPDMLIVLIGLHTLTANDFVLGTFGA